MSKNKQDLIDFLNFNKNLGCVQRELSKKGEMYDVFAEKVEKKIQEVGVVYLPFVVEDDRELAKMLVDAIFGLK